MAWTNADRFDFHMAQFRARKVAQEIQRDRARKPEAVFVDTTRTGKALEYYLNDVLKLTPSAKAAFKAEIASTYRPLS